MMGHSGEQQGNPEARMIMTVTIRYRRTGITLCAYRIPAALVYPELLADLWLDASRFADRVYEVSA